MPPSAIPFMVLKPDGMIVLDQRPMGTSNPILPVNSNWLDQVPVLSSLVEPAPVGKPVLKVVSSRGLASDTSKERAGLFQHRRRKRSKLRVRLGAVAILVLAIIAAFLLSGNNAGAPMVGAPIPSEPAVGAGGGAGRDADSLFYSVQVAAFDTWDRAMEYASGFERGSLAAAVTPIHAGGRIWYRVILGALATAQSADTVLRAFWRDGLVEAGQGTILRTPQAFDLGSRRNVDLAREETQRLRSSGIPAYSVVTGGAAIILVGAFETPDQSSVAESLLTAAGLPATLILRTGITP